MMINKNKLLHTLVIMSGPLLSVFGTQGRDSGHYTVDIAPIRTSRFGSTFLLRAAKKWNALPVTVFSDKYYVGDFKERVKRLLLGRHDPSSATSSLFIKRDCGQMLIFNEKKKKKDTGCLLNQATQVDMNMSHS